jgi:SAM-dependent methyltransferase
MAHDHDHHQHGHKNGHGHGHAPGGLEWGDLIEEFEIEAAALAPLLRRSIDEVAAAVDGSSVERIIDLGSGPGVAAVALAERFTAAHVTAADASPTLLAEAARRAERHGVADRFATEQIDLEMDLVEVGQADLVWASMVLHHVDDLPSVLTRVAGVVRPGGTLAVVEFGPSWQSLPDDLPAGTAGLGARFSAAVHAAIEGHLPGGAMAIDWQASLAAAGLEPVSSTVVDFAASTPLDDLTDRWLVSRLRRSAERLALTLEADDLAALARLAVDESTDLRRSIALHDDRWLHISRRPS